MCDCIKMVNDALADKNTILSQAITFGKSKNPGLMIETDRIEKGRGKPSKCVMFASYCPFCGEKYDSEDKTNG